MNVIRAAAMGMCFGVRDALRLTTRLADPSGITIHGELVHNEAVVDDLSRRGFQMIPEGRRDLIPETPRVLITAHGISRRERGRLLSAGKSLIDTTCPLVRHVQRVAVALQQAGYFVIVLGRHDHVEVQGIIGDLERYAVVEGEQDVRTYDAGHLGIVCQSTTAPTVAGRLVDLIEVRNPGKDIRFVDTICKPTRDRQEAAMALLDQVEALVVVGGQHSNNTRQLAALAESRGLPVLHVQGADDIEPAWFGGFRVVGLTAGTSTLDRTIDEVQQALLVIGRGSGVGTRGSGFGARDSGGTDREGI